MDVTLARLVSKNHEYLNYDYVPHRSVLRSQSWDRKKDLVVFDELHKMRGWKSWIKGIYDVEGVHPGLLVTGSARLDTAKKTGDSLAGRFFQHRLHPFDIKEVQEEVEPKDALRRLMSVGGFPEPFLADDPAQYARWQSTHLDMILRQDLLDLETVRDIPAVETLVQMLSVRVGSPVSYAGLARDLERDPKTIRRWLRILENLYVVFPVRPLHRNIARAILKEPKYYLRTKDGREVDFCVSGGKDAPLLIEAKHGDADPVPSLAFFGKFLPGARKVQIVAALDRERTYRDGTEVRDAATWLARMPIVRNAEGPAR